MKKTKPSAYRNLQVNDYLQVNRTGEVYQIVSKLTAMPCRGCKCRWEPCQKVQEMSEYEMVSLITRKPHRVSQWYVTQKLETREVREVIFKNGNFL